MSIPTPFNPLGTLSGLRRVPYVRIAGPDYDYSQALLQRLYPLSSSNGYEAWAKIQIVENNADIKGEASYIVAFGRYDYTPSAFVFYRGLSVYAELMAHLFFPGTPRVVGAQNVGTYPGDVVELTYRLGTCVVRLGSRKLYEKTGLQWESPGKSVGFSVYRVGGMTYDFYGAKITLDTGLSVEYVPVKAYGQPGIAVLENGEYITHVTI